MAEINAAMSHMTPKEKALQAIQGLPTDATLDDAMERLYVLKKIEKGLEESDSGLGIPHEKVEKHLLG